MPEEPQFPLGTEEIFDNAPGHPAGHVEEREAINYLYAGLEDLIVEVGGKADDAQLSALSAELDLVEVDVSNNASAIFGLENVTIPFIESNVAANASNIQDNEQDIEMLGMSLSAVESDVSANASAIFGLENITIPFIETDVATNASNIQDNEQDIDQLQFIVSGKLGASDARVAPDPTGEDDGLVPTVQGGQYVLQASASGGGVESTEVATISVTTLAQYRALTAPDPETLYVAVDVGVGFLNGSTLWGNLLYLAGNGTTVVAATFAQEGDTAPVQGVTYTLRTVEQITPENAATSCTTGITDLASKFTNDSEFNEDVSSWDVSNVTSLSYTFNGSSFNQPIGNWDVSNVTTVAALFRNSSFNQPIGNWDVSNVTNMFYAFYNSPFNQPIGNWDVSNVTDMSNTFRATPFNQPIGNWDVSNVTTMNRLFAVTPFDQDISAWDVSNVTNMGNMFQSAGLSTVNYDALLIAWAQLPLQPNVSPNFGSSTYSTDGTGDPLTDPAAARAKIANDFGWTITDGGPA